MLTEGAAVDAAETFAAILGEEPENAAPMAGWCARIWRWAIWIRPKRFCRRPGRHRQIQGGGRRARAAGPCAEAANAGPETEFAPRSTADPGNHQARFDLATALHAAGKVEEAVDELLELFRRDREWNDGAAKAQLITIFDALKPQDPIVLAGGAAVVDDICLIPVLG
jgi:putative thioredoxin